MLVHHWIVVHLSLEDQNKVCFEANETLAWVTKLWQIDGMLIETEKIFPGFLGLV